MPKETDPSAPRTGGCWCGAVRYRLTGDGPAVVYACHCAFCQTWSGSAFALHALVQSDALETGGAVVLYDDPAPGGARTVRAFCATCHTRLYNAPAGLSGMVVLSAGTLDDGAGLEPLLHMWVSRKHPWVTLPPDRPAFAESPTPEAFFAAIGPAVAG